MSRRPTCEGWKFDGISKRDVERRSNDQRFSGNGRTSCRVSGFSRRAFALSMVAVRIADTRDITNAKLLKTSQDDSRILHGVFDLPQEHNGLTSVDQPMIVRQGYVHHWPNYNLRIQTFVKRYELLLFMALMI